MNSDMLLNRIRMAQQGLIGVHKKLYTLEHLLPSPNPVQFVETAKSAALLSERNTASLRGFLFTIAGGMPDGYYQQAAAVQGIKVSATDDYVLVRVPALLPKKKAAEGFKFLVVPLQAAFEEYCHQHTLPHFSECVICIEHIYDRCLPITAVRDYDNVPIPAPSEDEKPAETPPPRRRRRADAPVLTIESGDEIETEDAREAAAWHEIHNAYRTRRILSAPLGGIEQTDSGKTIAVVDYNGFRIVIPLKEMMVISTVTAVVCAAVALLLMNFSKNGKTVDDSRAWLKRIAITWAILNGLGFIMAYVTPFFQGGTWNP